MRILHISKYYYPYIGGVENICRYLVDGEKDSECAVVCFNDTRSNSLDMVHGVKVYRVGAWVTIARQALSGVYVNVLKKAIREFKPDIIHFHWANPFPAAILLMVIPKNVKLVIHWHMDIIKQKKIYPFIRPIEKTLLERADLVIVTSPNYKEGSKPLQPFLDKVKVLPNAIDEAMMCKRGDDDVQILKVKERYHNKKIVFFVGRHIQYKGLPCLIEAEAHIKNDCEIIIAGNGPLTEDLKGKCHSKRVHFVGRLSDDELRWYHYAASVFAFPSITKNEAFGVALAEAMYCHTPAVTFTIPGSGVNWVSLNGVTGIEVPNGNSIAFAAAIDKLIENNELADKYGDAGHKRVVENFTIPHMVKLMDEYYKEL